MATGGTFEKTYDEINQVLGFKESHLPEILKSGRSEVPTTIEVLFLMDSLYMEDEHRSQVLEACKKAPEELIVITHGTDTMVKTATVLAEAMKDKTIVLTGAMVPYEFRNSDAYFNLGCALGFVQSLPHGIYIAMNSRVAPYNKIKKNLETGVFELLE